MAAGRPRLLLCPRCTRVHLCLWPDVT
jgi:hypothetical protein